jgi:hypothetical protein
MWEESFRSAFAAHLQRGLRQTWVFLDQTMDIS